MECEIMCAFPLLIVSDDMKEWSGFVTTKGQAIRISLLVPQFPSAEDVALNLNDLNEDARKYWPPILEEVSQKYCSDFLEYLRAIEELILPKKIDDGDINEMTTNFANINLYAAVIEAIEIIGTNNVVHLSRDFREVIIKHEDRSHREHTLKIMIPPSYPDKEPVVLTELPFPNNHIAWPKSIVDINKTFLTYMNKCCQFWNIMEDLDSYVKVIEPIKPNRNHYHRKILLEDNVIIHLTFNPLRPNALPGISFSGPEKIVEVYNQRLDQDCKAWDETDSIIQNLRAILECTFMGASPMDEDDESENEPCPICYTYEFEGEIPDSTCVCGLSYHAICLNDLFVSDVNQSRFRRTVECPNCQQEIRVPIRRAYR